MHRQHFCRRRHWPIPNQAGWRRGRGFLLQDGYRLPAHGRVTLEFIAGAGGWLCRSRQVQAVQRKSGCRVEDACADPGRSRLAAWAGRELCACKEYAGPPGVRLPVKGRQANHRRKKQCAPGHRRPELPFLNPLSYCTGCGPPGRSRFAIIDAACSSNCLHPRCGQSGVPCASIGVGPTVVCVSYNLRRRSTHR